MKKLFIVAFLVLLVASHCSKPVSRMGETADETTMVATPQSPVH